MLRSQVSNKTNLLSVIDLFSLCVKYTIVYSAQICKQASFWSPNLARAGHIFLKPDLGPKAKILLKI